MTENAVTLVSSAVDEEIVHKSTKKSKVAAHVLFDLDVREYDILVIQ